jgi:phosphoribosylpyrophosphate synthetase
MRRIDPHQAEFRSRPETKLRQRDFGDEVIMEKVVLYPSRCAAFGKALAAALGVPASACTDNIVAEPAGADTVICWDSFPSASSEKDPDIKVRVDALIGKHVILILSQDDTSSAFAQLSLLLWLQRFYVPTPDEAAAKGKWKGTIGAGSFEVTSVGALTVVIPWFRYCQMERSQRWTYTAGAEKPWSNAGASGPFVDVASAHTYAALLSAEPPPPPGPESLEAPPPPPPKEIVFVDIHDDLDGKPIVEQMLSKSGKWANPIVDYDLVHGQGTYFTSAFAHFLAHTYKSADLGTTFVVFPDGGAYQRFHTMVEARLKGIAPDHVLYIEKNRVGTVVKQGGALLYHTPDGGTATRESLPTGSTILIPDDFTNSGSTLFGGASIVRKHVQGTCKVGAFVTHFVAKYERAVVDKFVATLYSEGGAASDLNEFFTTDSIVMTTTWLAEEAKKRVAGGQPERVMIAPLAPVLAEWLLSRPTPAHAKAMDIS